MTTVNGTVESILENQSPLSFSEQVAQTTINQLFKPRWYQEDCVIALFDYFYGGGKGHPLAVVPTGAGKSHIIAMFCKQILEKWPDQKILILTHVDTIIRQDFLALLEHLPPRKVGIYSAGVGLKQRANVTVAGIQSIHTKHELFKETNIILIDEAHTVPPSGEGQYRKFLSHFNCPIVGLTATHFRLGTGYLHEGKGRIFTDIAYEVDIERLIEEGYLAKLIPRQPAVEVDMEGVATQNGDFAKKETVKRLDREGLTESIIEDLTQYKDNYKKWLLFAIDIDHAELVALLLNNASIRTAVVHSKKTKKENEQLKALFKEGMFDCLVSVESLTTGFDVPSVDLIALLRPTKSPVLHIQMIGRGLRIFEGKDHCLVLDYAGNVKRLGPINDVQIIAKRKKKGAQITKTCPNCKTILAGSVRDCPVCGNHFEFKEKLKDISANDDIIAKKKEKKVIEPFWYNVDHVTYSEHIGSSGLMMLVAYRCGIRTFFEYKKFEGGKIAYHSRHWWSYRARENKPAPSSSTEAVIRANSGDLIPPKQILVLEKAKYPEIQKTIF